MKKNLLLVGAVCAMALTACNQDDFGTVIQSNQTVTASMPKDAATRTALNGTKVVWSTNDAISVFALKSENTYSNNKGTITSGVGETDADFSVTIDGTTKVAAAYPYSSTSSYDGSTISLTMSESYTFVEDSILGAPMAAKISSDAQNATIAFQNAGALMRITVNNIPAGYNKATLTSTTADDTSATVPALTGACEIAFDTDGVPTMTTTTEATGKTITVNFTAAEEATSKTFYFPIPVAKYPALQIAISNGTDEKVLKTAELDAERSVRYNSTLTLDVVSGSIPQETTGGNAATSALESSSAVSVTITDSSDATISIPSNDNQVSLYFDAIVEGTTVTVQEKNNTTAASEVLISASSESTSNNFDIDLPNSTVTLAANGDAATYNEVTAKTAENTLIVGKGVTVNKLNVKGGHVRVHGKVGAISRHNDNSDDTTYIIGEEGAEVPSDLGENIQYMSAAEYDLRKAVAEGGSYTLTSDVTLTSQLTITDNFTLDLGGYTVNVAADTTPFYGIVNKGTLTISNGNVNYTTNDAGINYAAIYNAGVISLSEVSVESTNARCFVNYGKGTWTDGTPLQSQATPTVIATITGGEFKSTATDHNTGTHRYAIHSVYNTKLTMSGVRVEGGDGGISIDCSYGELTDVTASHTCTTGGHSLYVVAGEATIKGTCNFDRAYADVDTTYGTTKVNGVEYNTAQTFATASTEDALTAALTAGQNAVLTSDITLTAQLTVTTAATLNLGGNIVTVNAESTPFYGIVNKGTLAICNGDVVYKTSEAGINYAPIYNAGVITLTDVIVESSNSRCFVNYGKGTWTDDTKLQEQVTPTVTATITGGEFKSTSTTHNEGTHRYAIHSVYNTKLTMNGSKVEGGDGAISIDCSYGDLTNVTASRSCTTGGHALYVVAGEATYTSCTFENVFADVDESYGTTKVNGTSYTTATTVE